MNSLPRALIEICAGRDSFRPGAKGDFSVNLRRIQPFLRSRKAVETVVFTDQTPLRVDVCASGAAVINSHDQFIVPVRRCANPDFSVNLRRIQPLLRSRKAVETVVFTDQTPLRAGVCANGAAMINSHDQFIAPVRRCVNLDFSVNLHRFLRLFGLVLMAALAAPDAAFAQEHDHSQMDHGDMGAKIVIADLKLPDSANGSGTSRLPGSEGSHTGLHIMPGDDWMLMLHGYAWGVYTDQSGPRGDSKSYVQSMAMLSAEKDTGWGRVQLKSMMSLEPLMSNRGYPNLFATGETAGGEALVDRQHPHDLFMELAARVDFDVSDDARVFIYGGPVGEPALGPSAVMHRGSAKLNPEAPITHHWFDSNHITYGVGTIGFAMRNVQVEGSIFTGREPDERRWNIEKPRFDSWTVRATWNPSRNWALQASTGRLKKPEFLIHPDQDEQRSTASVHYANGNGLSAMLAFSAKDRKPGPTLTAWLAEANWDLDDHHTLFGRIENVRNDELFPEHSDPLHEKPFRVSKFQAGYAYRLPLTDDFNLALGGTVSAFAKPDALDAAYGRKPMGYTLFARLSLGL